MIIIDFIIKLLTILPKIRTIIEVCRKKGILSLHFVIPSIVIFVCGYNIYQSNLGDRNEKYKQINKRLERQKYIKEALIKCGNGTGISLSIIDLDKNDQSEIYPYRGRFMQAWAYSDNNIVNLVDVSSIYSEIQMIDNNSYLMLLEADNVYKKPKLFNLIDSGGIQTLQSLETFSSVKKMVEGLEWSKQGKLESLRIRSVVKMLPTNEFPRNFLKERVVVYVGTLLFAGRDNIRKMDCLDPDLILNNLMLMVE